MPPSGSGRFADAPALEPAWAVLAAAGLPDGAVRPLAADRFADDEVRSAVRVVAGGAPLDETSRELLLGWLCGFRDHFGQRFAALLDGDGGRLIAALERTPIDPGRFLKFRRIAIERLARLI